MRVVPPHTLPTHSRAALSPDPNRPNLNHTSELVLSITRPWTPELSSAIEGDHLCIRPSRSVLRKRDELRMCLAVWCVKFQILTYSVLPKARNVFNRTRSQMDVFGHQAAQNNSRTFTRRVNSVFAFGSFLRERVSHTDLNSC